MEDLSTLLWKGQLTSEPPPPTHTPFETNKLKNKNPINIGIYEEKKSPADKVWVYLSLQTSYVAS